MLQNIKDRLAVLWCVELAGPILRGPDRRRICSAGHAWPAPESLRARVARMVFPAGGFSVF